MATAPDIKHHPNQESKSGKPPFASPVKRNSSTNDPLQGAVVGGVEEKMRKDIVKSQKKKAHGKDVSRRHRPNTSR